MSEGWLETYLDWSVRNGPLGGRPGAGVVLNFLQVQLQHCGGSQGKELIRKKTHIFVYKVMKYKIELHKEGYHSRISFLNSQVFWFAHVKTQINPLPFVSYRIA
jgi:hypothetical protein